MQYWLSGDQLGYPSCKLPLQRSMSVMKSGRKSSTASVMPRYSPRDSDSAFSFDDNYIQASEPSYCAPVSQRSQTQTIEQLESQKNCQQRMKRKTRSKKHKRCQSSNEAFNFASMVNMSYSSRLVDSRAR